MQFLQLQKPVVVILVLFIAALAATTIVGISWVTVVVVLVPFLVFFALKKPFLLVFGMYVFLLPFDSILVIGREEFGPTVTKFLGIASIVVLFLTAILQKRFRKPEDAALWWGVFITLAVLSVGWGVIPEMIWMRIPTMVGLYVLYLIVSSYAIKREEFETILFFMICGGVCAAGFSLYAYYFLGASYVDSERLSLIVGERAEDPNQFCFALSISLALLMDKFLVSNKRVLKAVYLVGLAIVLYALLVSSSRGGLLGITAIVFTFAISRLKGKRPLIIAVSLMIFISLILLPEVFFERISPSAIQSQTVTQGDRLSIWKVGLDMFKDSWFLGKGIDGFPTSYPFYSGTFRLFGPHSNYVGMSVELGIVGILLFLVSMYKHLGLLRRRFIYRDHLCVMLTAALIGLSVESAFLDTVWRKSFWLLWMLIMMYSNLCREHDGLLLKRRELFGREAVTPNQVGEPSPNRQRRTF